MAITWVMAQGEDVLPIPEMKTRAHPADNLGAMDIQISREECDQPARPLRRVLPRLGNRADAYGVRPKFSY